MQLREPSRFLTYSGDKTEVVGQIMGPNMMGEYLTVVSAEYDVETDKTRLGFAYTTMDDLPPSSTHH